MADLDKKVQEEFKYHGAGYPVVLHHVPMIEIGGEWAVNMNMMIIDRLIFATLPKQKFRLTGNQIRFIRAVSDMTLQAFADRFGVSHPAVKKWENAGNGPTNMSWSTEKDIRLFVLSQSKADPAEFQQCYNALIDEADGEPAPIHVDLEAMAVAG